MKTHLNDRPVVRICDCGATLTEEWTDPNCVCGQPVPTREVPRRIQLGPSQQHRGMGQMDYRQNDKEKSKARREAMTTEQRLEENRKRRERRARLKEQRAS